MGPRRTLVLVLGLGLGIGLGFVAACGLTVEGVGAGPSDSTPGADGEAVLADAPGFSADGGAGDDAAPADAALEGGPCPAGRGPVMVATDRFCIDSTEVTLGQYRAFLASQPGVQLASLPPACQFKTGHQFRLTSHNVNDAVAVVGVDPRDAHAYCAWAGKRLCGNVADGGALSFGGADPPDASTSEWAYACSAAGLRQYPYREAFERGRCNDSSQSPDGLRPPGAFPRCEGGFPGILDMSGSVFEIENACDQRRCRVRGGSYMHDGSETLSCAGTFTIPQDAGGADLGFRCCANLR